MPKGGRRSTTWTPGWKRGKTTVIRIPEVLEDELLRIARVLDENGELPAVEEGNSIDKNVLKESANAYLLTISPKERLKAKKLIYGFIESVSRTAS
jgi:hypothetical protein